ncbi:MULTISPECIES: hypothetical protein [unclassified Pseudomonas]|uniref:hypothetical protein n=1 Tax=unclassified Pseudomonas TaxID=196821 RepID=UPI001472E092|nr:MULTISPECIES: hypothetical protein [unclassified Pseudomonas]NMX92991.1 hypothetical protein [Pseudomonas sp. WS 5086]NMY44821.1 hypothetical protein [Pseudomonas sp. WS 5027]
MMSYKSISSLSELILQAYVNEVCLDRSLKAKFLASEPLAEALPQYKVMPLLSLRKRYGVPVLWLLWLMKFSILPMLALAALGNLLLALVFLLPLFRRHATALPQTVCLPNTKNLKLFHYLFDDFDQRMRFECRRPWAVLRYLDAKDYLRAVLIVWRVLWSILTYPTQQGVRRKDLIFHVLDLLPLVWFSLFVCKLSGLGKQLVTDCNLQRWDYIATHVTSYCSIIQHAYIHADLEFAHPFGQVDCLYVFDPEFEAVFSRYYHFKRTDIIKPKLKLDDMGSEKEVLFLASSAPFLAIEIDFIERVKSRFDFFVVVKLHPRHLYDESVSQLTSLADHVAAPAVFPDCDYQVSYDSFLGYEYKALGKNVLFLKDECSIQMFMDHP